MAIFNGQTDKLCFEQLIMNLDLYGYSTFRKRWRSVMFTTMLHPFFFLRSDFSRFSEASDIIWIVDCTFLTVVHKEMNLAPFLLVSD